MHDARLVRRRECRGDLRDNVERFADRQAGAHQTIAQR